VGLTNEVSDRVVTKVRVFERPECSIDPVGLVLESVSTVGGAVILDVLLAER
jgi:hypothetical protein